MLCIPAVCPRTAGECWHMMTNMASHTEYLTHLHAALVKYTTALDFNNTPLPIREHITVNLQPLLTKMFAVGWAMCGVTT
jgi:hypothetical protein